MKKRAVITVIGDVQSIGYRKFIRRKAVENGLTGFAGNLPDGKVIIIADGDEEQIARFILELKIPSPPGNVEDVRIDYQETDGIFPDFFTAGDLEKNGDLQAKAEKLMEYVRDINSNLGAMNSQMGTMNSKLGNIEKLTSDSQDKLSSAIKEGFAGVRDEIREMSRQTGEHFDRLDNKYDTFGNKLDGMASDIKAMKELLTVFVEHFIKKETAEA